MSRIWALRGLHVLLFFAILFGVEGARLAWLQLGFGGAKTMSGSLIQHAVLQRSDELLLDTGRGQFRDRKGRLLTGVSVQSLAVFPDNGMKRGSEDSVNRLASTLGVQAEVFDQWLTELREPEVWMADHSNHAFHLTDEQIRVAESAKLLGVAVLPYRNRYPSDLTPIHAIGYISQHPERVKKLYEKQLANHHMGITNPIGGAGLEKSMDRLIQGISPTTVIQVTDATRKPLEGLGLRMSAPDNPHFPLQVTTTLDLDFQEITENTMDKYGVKKGAAVILDARNSDIMAMLSLPRLNPYHIGAEHTDEKNHALIAAPPGSIFKTVTLAAALESGVTAWDEEFHCDGHYGKYGLKCWREEGHGTLTLKEAYAESCNVVFAQLAERMDPAWIQITGERLGLGRLVGWSTEKFTDGKPLRLLEEEQAGSIFLDRKTAQDGGVRTGTGIGQRDVRVTPLQAANMVVSILHNGKVYAPRLVKNIRYADGGLMTSLPVQAAESSYGQIEPRTAAVLREGMQAVVQSGTASKALEKALWPLAGKSGTAELAGAQKTRNDQWFIGYGPAKGQPRYAIAVLIEDQPAGLRNRAAAVFGEIMNGLYLLEQQTLSAEERAEGR